MENKKTPWTDVSSIWKKIAGVIAAVGILATFVVQVFKTPVDWTYICFAALGFVFLMISWYVDKQALYTYKEMEECKKELVNDIEMHKKESQETVNSINANIDKLIEISEDTRKDTLRIQLMMLMQTEADNIDTILRVAEVYFVKLKGDWYMTSEFSKWAKNHDVIIPDNIWSQIKGHLDD